MLFMPLFLPRHEEFIAAHPGVGGRNRDYVGGGERVAFAGWWREDQRVAGRCLVIRIEQGEVRGTLPGGDECRRRVRVDAGRD